VVSCLVGVVMSPASREKKSGFAQSTGKVTKQVSMNHALYSEPKKEITTFHLPRVSFVELLLRRAKFTDFCHKKNPEVDRSSKMVSLKELFLSWVFSTVSHSKRKTSFWVKTLFRQLILQLIQESFRIFQRNL